MVPTPNGGEDRPETNDTPVIPIVYYLANMLGGPPQVVKIGTSQNVESRMKRLMRAQPELHPVLLATEPGGAELEWRRHRQFLRFRLQGEWFWLAGELKEFVTELRRSM